MKYALCVLVGSLAASQSYGMESAAAASGEGLELVLSRSYDGNQDKENKPTPPSSPAKGGGGNGKQEACRLLVGVHLDDGAAVVSTTGPNSARRRLTVELDEVDVLVRRSVSEGIWGCKSRFQEVDLAFDALDLGNFVGRVGGRGSGDAACAQSREALVGDELDVADCLAMELEEVLAAPYDFMGTPVSSVVSTEAGEQVGAAASPMLKKRSPVSLAAAVGGAAAAAAMVVETEAGVRRRIATAAAQAAAAIMNGGAKIGEGGDVGHARGARETAFERMAERIFNGPENWYHTQSGDINSFVPLSYLVQWSACADKPEKIVRESGRRFGKRVKEITQGIERLRALGLQLRERSCGCLPPRSSLAGHAHAFKMHLVFAMARIIQYCHEAAELEVLAYLGSDTSRWLDYIGSYALELRQALGDSCVICNIMAPTQLEAGDSERSNRS